MNTPESQYSAVDPDALLLLQRNEAAEKKAKAIYDDAQIEFMVSDKTVKYGACLSYYK